MYRIIILPLVLDGCETWSSLTLGEEHRLRVLENKVLTGILGPNRQAITGIWRKIRFEGLHKLYFSSNIIGMIKLRHMRGTEVVGDREMKTTYMNYKACKK
jgi:hypothetical protein